MEKLKGVNLGGWLVLERWMTPSLFEGSTAEDEFTFIQEKGAAAKLEKHWREFVTEEDFRWLHDNGLNAVRIPVGYWIFGDEKPYRSSIRYLDKAMRWAKKYNIHVLICLHAAPGSQNGQQHTGRRGKAQWFTSLRYQEKTLHILERLTNRYRSHAAFWGIELLNEPRLGIFHHVLRRFYRHTYSSLVHNTRVVFSDGYTPRLMSGALPSNAIMDVHWYHFTLPLQRFIPLSLYYLLLKHRGNLLRKLQKKNPIIIGEWSIVISTHTFKHFPKNRHEQMMDEHGRRQLEVYAVADGWFYWTYKTEGRGTWNFRSLIEDGRLILRND